MIIDANHAVDNLGEKALDCLRMASIKGDGRWTAYADLCRKYSENSVDRKMEELADRGYIEYGVSASTGWVTVKGVKSLEASLRKRAA